MGSMFEFNFSPVKSLKVLIPYTQLGQNHKELSETGISHGFGYGGRPHFGL
jgi:hypothetical protein